MLIVGLTGGIATGKSTVSERLLQHQIPIIDADVLARKAVEPGTRGLKKIVKHFSSKVPNLIDEETGSLNRLALGKYVFENAKERQVLNSIVHPVVKWLLFKNIVYYWLSGARLIILDVPLLFEGGLDRFCGTTVVVSCSLETQLDRLMKRDGSRLSKEDALNRINSQMAVQSKAKLADHVILNSGTIDDLNAAIDKLIIRLRPSLARVVLEWFAPVGLLMAIKTFLLRYFIQRRRRENLALEEKQGK